MLFQEFLARLVQIGALDNDGQVTDQFNITFNAFRPVDVRALRFVSDIDEGDEMIVYIDNDCELLYHVEDFKLSDFQIYCGDELINVTDKQ